MTEIMQWKIGGKMTKWMSNPPFTVFFPRHVITAQIMSWMPVSIDRRCHTFQYSPPPHKATQPCSIFRLLQCCSSEVNRFRNTLPLSKSHWSDLTSLFKQHIEFHKCAAVLLSQSTILNSKWGAQFLCLWYVCVESAGGGNDLGLIHTILPPCGLSGWWITRPWILGVTKWHKVNIRRNSSTYSKCLVKQYILQSY